jgi:addiction module HigA family antidote
MAQYLWGARPQTPGEVIRHQVLPGYGVTQDRLAVALGVSRCSVNEIINGRRGVSAEMAVRLAAVTSTTAEYWSSMQMRVDLHEARERIGAEVEKLPRLPLMKEEC